MKFHILLSLFLIVFLSQVSTTVSCHDHERAALLSFKSLLSDPSNRLSSWQGRNCCNWHGIRCSASLHVISVSLRNPNPSSVVTNVNSELVSTSNSMTTTALKGTISPSLFTLGHLHHVDLSFNDFMLSRIPTGISNLTRLTYLNLSNAMFSDTITTQFANLTSLRKMDLSCSFAATDFSTISVHLSSPSTLQVGAVYSYLHGGYLSSPSLNWLRGLHGLEELVLNGVDLSKACESPQWATPISLLADIRSLQLSNCSISGKVPVEQLLNLTQLSVLVMDSNSLTSQIPAHLANLTSLVTLDFSLSSLQGSIPYFPQLIELYLSNCLLTIDLDSMFAEPWPKLQTLFISSNRVVGSIPPSNRNATSLKHFAAMHCLIEGDFSSFLTNLSRLETLQLGLNKLSGHIPPSISNLKGLQLLSLLQNSIEGSIPDSVCNLSSLWYIDLQLNKLTGELPSCISHLPNLQVLYVTMNSLTGTVESLPSLFRRCAPRAISLGYNNFLVKLDQQPFPPNFQPQTLDLSSCKIEGSIPVSFSNLTKLVYLNLANNSLTGNIPSWLFNLPKLGFLDLSLNKLQGPLPSEIRLNSYYGFTNMNLANNFLQGPIPSLLENIDSIVLSENNFTGYIPEKIGLGHARYLSLSGNKLYGPIPASFCPQNSVLKLLDLSNNSFSGVLPGSLGNCTSLISLQLAHNKLYGRIPDALGNARKLSYIDLTSNHFHGPLPSFIRKLKLLEALEIGYNNFSGRLPGFIGDLPNLRILVFRSNLFNGTIPEEINKLQKLQVIDLSNNKLSGHIPDKLGGLKTLRTRPTDGDILGHMVSLMYTGVEMSLVSKGIISQYKVVHTYLSGIDLSLNDLTGNIPSEIVLLKGLFMLNLSHNRLSDGIPSNIGDMSGLESLDLSFNNLSGAIPASINTLDALGVLKLSYNNFSGRIPSGTKFDTFYGDGSAYVGNKYLCGAPHAIINCDLNSSSVSPSQVEDDVKERGLFTAIVIIGYGVGFGGHFWLLYFMKAKWSDRYWRVIDMVVSRIMHYFSE